MNRPSDSYCYCVERYNKVNMKILTAMRDVFIETILSNSDGILLPDRWGALYINGHTRKNADRQESKKNKKKILYQNYNTHGVTYYLHSDFFQRRYNKVKVSFSLSKYFLFYSYKKIKKAILKQINDGNFYDWKTNI